jgi:hypothetical protein
MLMASSQSRTILLGELFVSVGPESGSCALLVVQMSCSKIARSMERKGNSKLLADQRCTKQSSRNQPGPHLAFTKSAQEP